MRRDCIGVEDGQTIKRRRGSGAAHNDVQDTSIDRDRRAIDPAFGRKAFALRAYRNIGHRPLRLRSEASSENGRMFRSQSIDSHSEIICAIVAIGGAAR